MKGSFPNMITGRGDSAGNAVDPRSAWGKLATDCIAPSSKADIGGERDKNNNNNQESPSSFPAS